MHGIIRSTEDLGRAVLARRLALGLTQNQLASALGISQRYVSELETGKPKNLGAKLFDILDQLDIELRFQTTVQESTVQKSR